MFNPRRDDIEASEQHEMEEMLVTDDKEDKKVSIILG